MQRSVLDVKQHDVYEEALVALYSGFVPSLANV